MITRIIDELLAQRFSEIVSYGLCKHIKHKNGDTMVKSYETGRYVDVTAYPYACYHRIIDAILVQAPGTLSDLAVMKTTNYQTGFFSIEFPIEIENFFYEVQTLAGDIAQRINVDYLEINPLKISYTEELAHAEDFGPYKLPDSVHYTKIYWNTIEKYRILCKTESCPELSLPDCTSWM